MPERRRSQIGSILTAAALVIGLTLASVSPAVAKSTTSLTLAVSSTAIALTKPVTVSGTLKSGGVGVSGAQVKISGQPIGGSWQTLRTVVTNSSGGYSFTFTPTSGIKIGAAYAGNATYAGSTAATRTVTVQPQLYDVKFSGWNGLTVGETKAITGRSVAQMGGKRVVLLWYTSDSGWLQVGESRFAADGTFNINFIPQGVGTQKYRIYIPAIAGLQSKIGPDLTITSYRWLYLDQVPRKTQSSYFGVRSTSFNANGKTYQHGVYGYAYSSTLRSASWDLKRSCRTFRADAALADYEGTYGDSAQFVVSVDGAERFSQTKAFGTTTSMNYDVTNALELKLGVANSGGIDSYFAGAQILCPF